MLSFIWLLFFFPFFYFVFDPNLTCMISIECGIRNDTIVYVCLSVLIVCQLRFIWPKNLNRFDSSCYAFQCTSSWCRCCGILWSKTKLFHIYSCSSTHSIRHMPHAVIIELVHQLGLTRRNKIRWNETQRNEI